MPVHHDEAFPVAFGILLAGMLAPALVVAAGRDLLAMYVSSGQFVVIAAAAFWLLAWILLEGRGIDRTSFALVAVAWPWPILFAALFGFLLLHRGQQIPRGPLAEVFRYLIGDVGGFLGYGALFALAGAGAAGAARAIEALARRDARVPEGRVTATGLGLAVAAVVVLAVGANLAAAGAVTVAGVGPATDMYDRPTLEVTVDGAPAELRLTAVAPDGSRLTRRLTRAEMRGAPVRVGVPIVLAGTPSHTALPALAGTYRVRVTALTGVTVDMATFTAASGTNVSLLDAQATAGEPAWEQPPNRTFGAVRHDTNVAVLLENGGSFHAPVSVAVGTPDDARRVVHRELTAAPGERFGVVVSIPADTVESIRAASDGTATVRVYVGEPEGDTVATVRVELPPA